MSMDGLLELLENYADSDYLPMHMPGHKRRMGMSVNPYRIDLTEIEGSDNLHHAEGILLEAERRAAALYHSEETHYLINGSTAGVLSAVSGCTAFGGTLLMARNSHKSVYHGALLKGLKTTYLYPHSTGGLGINGVIFPEDVDRALAVDPKIQAVVVTSPTYDGIVSDVERIAGIVHAYGKPLIVDEAHGAHFPFSDGFPKDSVSCGADVVIHSVHKTLPSLTQTALIHLNGTRIDREKIRNYLRIYQTSSPSYVLMAGIDECMRWISGHPEAFRKFQKDLEDFRRKLRELKHLKLIEVPGMDRSKILISVQGTGLSGRELAKRLREEYQIEVEMACGTYLCAITTAADTKAHLERFQNALSGIDRELAGQKDEAYLTDEVIRAERVCTLLQAEESGQEWTPLSDACGKISGDFITLYPPGIPMAAPGELLTEEMIQRICWYTEHELEVDGVRRGQIRTVKRGSRWERYSV